jgi:hypothetical protein
VVALSATSYAEAALQRRGGYYTITQPLGLDAAQVTELIRATLRIVRPDYLGDPAASLASE